MSCSVTRGASSDACRLVSSIFALEASIDPDDRFSNLDRRGTVRTLLAAPTCQARQGPRLVEPLGQHGHCRRPFGPGKYSFNQHFQLYGPGCGCLMRHGINFASQHRGATGANNGKPWTSAARIGCESPTSTCPAPCYSYVNHAPRYLTSTEPQTASKSVGQTRHTRTPRSGTDIHLGIRLSAHSNVCDRYVGGNVQGLKLRSTSPQLGGFVPEIDNMAKIPVASHGAW